MLGFVFPGQGSQSVGMGAFLYQEFQQAKDIFVEASEAIGVDLKKLCFESTAEELARTENTQPALLTVSVATSRVLQEVFGLKPQLTAGHSIGEYASLVLSQSLTFPDAVKAVRLRGQAMQSAVPAGLGGMTAVLGLTEKQVEFLCAWACKNSGFGPLSAANYNCDGQIVISGNKQALTWLKDNFNPEIIPDQPKKARLIPLQVSAPFHCEMMKPAQTKMEEFFKTVKFSDAKIPVLQNVNASKVVAALKLKENLIQQVSAPVKWTQTMQQFKNENCFNIIECGHGTVLKGLFKKADAEAFKVYSTNSLDDLKALKPLK